MHTRGAPSHRYGEFTQSGSAARCYAPDGEMTAIRALDSLAILGALHRREVRFIVIGGVAGYLLGSSLLSANLDICFATDFLNTRRLMAALNDMHAQLRGSSDDHVDEQTLLRVEILSFKTDHGVLHCLGAPAGTEGYDDLM